MDHRSTLAARIQAETQLARVPLVPELALHLIGPDCRLWHADEKAAAEAGLPEPYWAFAWPGGQALARYLLDESALVRDRHVLDVGAGGALEGLAALRAGARRVVAADLDPVAAVAAQLNTELNALAGLETITADLIGLRTDAEVVLAGDVFYDRALAQRGRAWLEQLAREGRLVLVADPGRGFLSLEGMELLATYAATRDGDLTGSDTRPTGVYRLR